MDKLRIAKFISSAGYCSRRKAEELIFQLRVQVNGKVIDSPANFVGASDVVTVDGEIINHLHEQPRLWLYYKPVGLITTHDDPQNRDTVFANLPKSLPRLVSVGRLDINSEGLLLLTNSGKLAEKLALPQNNFIRVYKVRARGGISKAIEEIKRINDGKIIPGINNKEVKIVPLTNGGYNNWFEVELREGKNREIRKLFEHIGLEVNRLIRVQFGNYYLGNLKPGEIMEVKKLY